MTEKIIKNCPKCNQPLTPGNIKKEPFGKLCKYTRRVHKKCPDPTSKLASSNSQLRSPAPSINHPEQPSVIDRPAERNLNLPYRLFVDSVTLARVQRIAGSGGRTVFMTAHVISDPSLPDREPESFRELAEVKIMETC